MCVTVKFCIRLSVQRILDDRSAMKYRLLLRRVLGVLGVVLASVRLGLARPSAPKASDPHSLNCSSISTRVSDHHTRSTSEELQAVDVTRDDDFEDLVVHDHVTPSPSSSANSTQPYSYHNVSLYYYASVESNYFDYYYEDPEDTFSTLEPSHEDQTAGGYQPPPGLARVAKLKLIKTPRRQPPEYMLELYDRFSKAASPVTTRSPEKGSPEVSPDLGADIVRSFPNINKEGQWCHLYAYFRGLVSVGEESTSKGVNQSFFFFFFFFFILHERSGPRSFFLLLFFLLFFILHERSGSRSFFFFFSVGEGFNATTKRCRNCSLWSF